MPKKKINSSMFLVALLLTYCKKKKIDIYLR